MEAASLRFNPQKCATMSVVKRLINRPAVDPVFDLHGLHIPIIKDDEAYKYL